MMLEDLYVRPNQRRKGTGRKLFRSVAEVPESIIIKTKYLRTLF